MKAQRPGDQPMPTPNGGEAVWPLIIAFMRTGLGHVSSRDGSIVSTAMIADMEARDRLGRERYGTPLQPHNGRDVLQDLYEELLDACAYAMQATLEMRPGGDDEVRAIFLFALQSAGTVRLMMIDREAAHG